MMKKESLKDYWQGTHIKHLDSVRELGTRQKSLVYIRDLAKKSLTVETKISVVNFKGIIRFLRRCKYVPDKEQFDKGDYWQTPDEFEGNRKGDCEDFALWAWRKLVDLGAEARFAYGIQGGEGHAWIILSQEDRPWIFETIVRPWWYFQSPLISISSNHGYIPIVSIDKNLNFFKH